MDYYDDPKVIDGRKLAAKRETKLVKKIAKLKVKPKVVSILIGDDPSSMLYTKMKQKKARSLGIEFDFEHFRDDTRYSTITDFISTFNKDPEITGIMVQLPLPEKFLTTKYTTRELLDLIDPVKDIDGLTSNSHFETAAVEAVFDIIEEEDIEVEGKNCVVVGSSELIGKPIFNRLQDLNAEAVLCNRQTKNLKRITKKADVLISATGVPSLIKGDMVKNGVVVIDVGVMVIEEPKNDEEAERIITGDAEYESVYKKASKITPVPGGVGPVTVIALMENAVKAVTRL